MNKHKMSKKLLATIMTFAMLITMFPSGVFAQDSGSKYENGQVVSGTVTNTENGVTMNKYVTGNAQDGYELTLEGYASNQLTTTSTSTPLDIVLVLDVSGSMEDDISGIYTSTGEKDWSYDSVGKNSRYYFLAFGLADCNASTAFSIPKSAWVAPIGYNSSTACDKVLAPESELTFVSDLTI